MQSSGCYIFVSFRNKVDIIVQFYCDRFGTTFHDAITLVKERKVKNDKDIKELLWFMMECVVCPQMSLLRMMCLS